MDLLPEEYPKVSLMIKTVCTGVIFFYISINLYTLISEDWNFFVTNLGFSTAGVLVYFLTVYILLRGHKTKQERNQKYVKMIPTQMNAAGALLRESIRRNKVMESEKVQAPGGAKLKTM